MSKPSISAVPSVGARQPVIIFIMVDLPAPFGPIKPTISPSSSVNEKLSSAVIFPYFFVTDLTSSITH